jgi:RNA polymerase sigma factor (sigma-70 family)
MMEFYPRCLEIFHTFNEILILRGELALKKDELATLCLRVQPYLDDDMSPQAILKIAEHYFYDGPMVKALMAPEHPDHDMYWRQFHQWCKGIAQVLLKDVHDRDDFLQDAYFHFRRKINRYSFRSTFKDWAFVVLRRFFFDWIRRRHRRPTMIAIENVEERGSRAERLMMSMPMSHPQEYLERQEREALLVQLMNILLSDRDILLLRLSTMKKETGNNMTDADIARIVGLSPSSISQTRKRLYARLRNHPMLQELIAEFS